ncbi:MAG: iron ABC transporter permease [Deltaproteobacteria bacterium]|nr:iron ABC transporter permease [Deltaproteobacteria bacterium]
MIILSGCLIAVGVLAVSTGAVSIQLSKTWSILLHHFLGLTPSVEWTGGDSTIILNLRWPRVISGALVGAALSIAGAVLQALLRNPLADPYVLGISSGAAVGAILAILFGLGSTILGSYAIPGAAFGGALLTLLFVYFLARVQGRLPSQTMLLAGVIVSSFFSAIIMFLISITTDERLHSVTFWLMGNLAYVASQTLGVIFLYLLLGSAVLFSLAKDLNLMALGEETASELGVEVERVKKTAFIFASLITGAVVSVSGLIGFVGLVVPHLVRMIWGPDHRFLIPASALLGALLLVLADMVARTIMAPSEIPVGVVTALGGAPFFIYLLRRKGFAANR